MMANASGSILDVFASGLRPLGGNPKPHLDRKRIVKALRNST